MASSIWPFSIATSTFFLAVRHPVMICLLRAFLLVFWRALFFADAIFDTSFFSHPRISYVTMPSLYLDLGANYAGLSAICQSFAGKKT